MKTKQSFVADLVAGGGFVFVHVVRGECITHTHTHTHTQGSHGACLLPVFAPSLTLSLFRFLVLCVCVCVCVYDVEVHVCCWKLGDRHVVCALTVRDHSLNNKSVPHLLSPLSVSFVRFPCPVPHPLSLSHFNLINLEPALARDQCMHVHVSVAILITTLIKFMCTHSYTASGESKLSISPD